MTNPRKYSSFILMLCLGLAACDLPTKSPDFSFTADIDAPLFFDKSFIFLGPDSFGNDPLIDTTKTSFDSLFTVSSGSEEIFIVQEIDDFDIGDIDNVIDPVSIQPFDLGVTIGSLASPSFSGSADQTVGIYESPNVTGPSVPVLVEGSEAFFPLTVGDFLSPPDNDLIDMSGATISNYIFTAESSTANALTFVLLNNLPETLTDGSFANGSIPQLVIANPGSAEIGRFSFDVSPIQGQTATAVVDVSSITLPSTARFQVDVGTTNGFQPIVDNPQGLGVAASTTILRYDGVGLTSLPNQSSIGDSNTDFTIAAEIDFVGIVTTDGSIDLEIANNLPIPIVIEEIRLSNIDAIDTYPVGHTFATASGHSVAANATSQVPLNLGATGIGREVRATVIISSAGSASPLTIFAQDGVSFDVVGSAEIDRVYFRPQAEEFTSSGIVSIDVDAVRFDSPSDFVELSGGTLNISNLVNNLDVAMDDVEITFPQIRVSPFTASDSIRIRFEGGTDNPSAYIFRSLGRNQAPRDVAINLANTRLYLGSGDLEYSVVATAEQSTQVRMLGSGDEISSSVSASQIEISSVQASIDPIAFDLTDDADGNGVLDVLQPSESIETILTAISDLADFGFSSLSLSGSELTLEIASNVSANYVVYAAIAGIDGEGNVVYLGGRGDAEVAAGDSMVAHFVANGSPIENTNLIRLDIAGGGNSTSTIVLSKANSSVDEFINALPSTMRLAARVVVEPNGGSVSLQLPLDIDIGLGASIPLRFRGDATFNKMVSADLSGLDNLTDEAGNISLDAATLRLSFENSIPLGLEARIHIVDENGSVITQIPAETEAPMTITSAETGEFGTGTTASVGVSEILIDRQTLADMALGADIELVLNLSAGQQGVRRVHASDQIKVNLSGEFDLKVSTGN